MTAAALGRSAWSFSAFSANGGNGFCEQRAQTLDDRFVDGKFLDATFKFTYASRSWVIGLSFHGWESRSFRTSVTGQVTTV
jgi:hypothetical protein